MRLTVYMFQPGTTLETAIDSEKVKEKNFERINKLRLDQATCYVHRPKQKKPKWVNFIAPIAESKLPPISTRSASAVLAIQASDRVFAIPFGYGRGILNLDKIEPNFGLKVALNSLDPTKLRSLDKKNYEDMVISSSISLSSQSDLSNFSLDKYSDILRQATGTPLDTEFARRVTGADSLTINKEIEAVELPDFCTTVMRLFDRDDYKSEFGWIDNLKIVKDHKLIESLDQMLLEDLKNKQVSRSHMALPENIDWQDIDSFRIQGTNSEEFEELDLNVALDAMEDDLDSLTVKKLKSRRVGVVFARSDEADYRWSFYRCLVSEQDRDDHLYALIEGSWFQIHKKLATEVNNFIDSLPNSAITMPQHSDGEAEQDYNVKLASTSTDLLLMDRNTASVPGESGTVELCDVLSKTGELVHVKRKSHSSSLSHLFAQGLVSMSTLFGDKDFRRSLQDRIQAAVGDEDPTPWLSLIPENDAELRKTGFKVTYAIVPTNSYQDNRWLPFFSKLNLMSQARTLRIMGVDVALKRIPSERYG